MTILVLNPLRVLGIFSVGVVTAVAGFIVWPGPYIDIAERFRWRLGAPSVGQIQLEQALTTVQSRGESISPNGGSVLFGDSHLQGLPSSVLGVDVSNFAIAGEPAVRLAKRIGLYRSITKARQVVLMSGTNDLMSGTTPDQVADAIFKAAEQIPPHVVVLIVEVPPTRSHPEFNKMKAIVNHQLTFRCDARPRCHMVRLRALADSQGLLRAEYASSDGVHLTIDGYSVLAEALKTELVIQR